MSLDRSKFKRSSVTQMQQADTALNKTMGRKEKEGNGHTVEDGINLFRIYPVHPDVAEKDPKAVFAQPHVSCFIPAMVKERDSNKKEILDAHGKPKMKEGVRPVYNTKIHGGTPKDLIEEYIRIAKAQAGEMELSKEDYKEYLKPIYGLYVAKGHKNNVMGINYTQEWVVYADKYPYGNSASTPVFDELRLKKSIKERLNKISASEASSDPLGTDPFTDIEEGKAVKIIKDPNADQAANTYTTELDNSSTKEVIGGRTVSIQKTYPLTDAQLEYFLQQEPLSVKYGKKLATRQNFELQLAGLAMLDAKWEMGIFDAPEWSKIVSEIDAYFPEAGATDNSADQQPEDTAEETDLPDNNSDEFDLMSRAELQAFAKENKTGILVRPALGDDAVRDLLRNWKKTSHIEQAPLPNEAGYVAPEPAVQVTKEKETAEEKAAFIADLTGEAPAGTVPMTTAEKLAALRNKKKLHK